MSEMPRLLAVDRIGTAGLERTVDATADELPAIATRLQLPAVGRLRCRFELKRVEGAIFAAAGVLSAEVRQVCVVSLEEFDEAVTDPFAVRFVPAGTESEEDDPDAPDQIPYPAGAIDLGEAAIEQLALALNPYPRKPGLEQPEEVEAETPGPFASLAALRRPQ